MSDNSERPEAEPVSPPSSSSNVEPDGLDGTCGPKAKGSSQAPPGEDLLEALKREAANNRLPRELLEEIIAELPPPEERARLYRELQEKGGLSFEGLWASLDLDSEPQP